MLYTVVDIVFCTLIIYIFLFRAAPPSSTVSCTRCATTVSARSTQREVGRRFFFLLFSFLLLFFSHAPLSFCSPLLPLLLSFLRLISFPPSCLFLSCFSVFSPSSFPHRHLFDFFLLLCLFLVYFASGCLFGQALCRTLISCSL